MNAVADRPLVDFARLQATLPGRELPWLAGLRAEALAAFAASGYPTLRDEDWKYTSVAAIEQAAFALQPPAAAGSVDLGDLAAQVEALALPGALRLVFVDGRYAPALSRCADLPAGVTVAGLAETLVRAPETLQAWLARPRRAATPLAGFAALNAAGFADGAYIHVAAGVALAQPLQLLFVATADKLATHSRNLIVAEAGCRLDLVEQHAAAGAAAYLSNVVSDLAVGAGAVVAHYQLQEEGARAFHVAAVNAELGAGARFASASFAFGAALARTDIAVALAAENAECTLDGLYLADGRQHVDHHTRIDHLVAHGTSREFYKGVLAGAGRAVFNGKVVIHADAQHSDAAQSNRNLLLSPNAEVDTKPQLEIWADDVKCSHGATVGPLDPEPVFYLRSRGLAEAAAKRLLTYAFAAEMVERVPLAALRARLDGLLRARLPQADAGAEVLP
ncbi:Fe-S cluster assembly protein SufD [Azospira restricta]|uniref:Fe-S cluster assembly protein SufD n=1 Tax=Azospira restricta TaxID=404405 RepID=A0A974PVN7_9RHOO|nr:Fe-S cluster assembly protein SufD [Azospira restricta]QRJ62353.1 Fe-S cluster assembly protein SufD [Azospira restricta]